MVKKLCIPLVLLFGLSLFPGCADDVEETAKAVPLKVVLAEVEETMVPIETSFNGTLTAKETVEVRARISGYLMERPFSEGALVQEGDVIYRLDDRDLKASLDAAKANTAKAESTWKNAETTKERYVPLAKTGAVSAQERDFAVTKAEESLAFYNAAKSDEEKAAVNLSYATIRAPIAGYIDRSKVDVGGFVEAGSDLLTTIYRIDPIRAEFSVTDREFSRFKRAMHEGEDPRAVSFRLELSDDRFPYEHKGILEMADPVVDRKTNTMGVRVEFPNPEHKLRPGLYVNIVGILEERKALMVPEVAILDLGGGKAVLTVDADNILVAVPVEVGKLLGDKREITKGLNPGQKVVVEGLVTAQPGMKVEIVSKRSAPKPEAGQPGKTQPGSDEVSPKPVNS